jgi:choline dehydrogenase-like flavoprotein
MLVVDRNDRGRVPPQSLLSRSELRSALALTEALIPGSQKTPGADETTVHRALDIVERSGLPGGARTLRGALWMFDQAARLRTGRALHDLSRTEQDRLLREWEESSTLKGPLNTIGLLLKTAHFDQPQMYEHMGGRLKVLSNVEVPRYERQIVAAGEWEGERFLECDVVVVGTGAGGAVVGTELALRGHAVVFVEEGKRFQRSDYTGGLVHAHTNFFRNMFAASSSPIFVLAGKMVGGSTTVNGGSCFRPPPWVLDEWCERFHTDEFRSKAFDDTVQRVETRLSVSVPERRFIGPIADVMDRGAAAMGWRTEPIPRNAVGCEGQGFCDFGCSSGARRSVEVSYLPSALERGALVLSELHVDRVWMEDGRAVGVIATDRAGAEFRVRAKRVVLAGGAIPTPLLLLQQGLANRSGEVGKNLSLHPSAGFGFEVDDRIDPDRYIPQGYVMNQFVREGWIALAAQPSFNCAQVLFPTTGTRFMRAMDSVDHLAYMGLLIRDTSRGRVWSDVDRQPIISYSLNAHDTELMGQAFVRMGEMAWAAGAKRLYYSLLGRATVESRADFADFRTRRFKHRDMLLLSYHPLGTCQMGTDPQKSVVDTFGQVHDVPGLFIADGSIVPTSLGVNPQITIMALATRVADRVHESL